MVCSCFVCVSTYREKKKKKKSFFCRQIFFVCVDNRVRLWLAENPNAKLWSRFKLSSIRLEMRRPPNLRRGLLSPPCRSLKTLKIFGIQNLFFVLVNVFAIVSATVPFPDGKTTFIVFFKTKFKKCDNFVIILLNLPNSNATVERIFSTYSLIKTERRNLLDLETFESIIWVKEHFKSNGKRGHEINITEDMMRKFNLNTCNLTKN